MAKFKALIKFKGTKEKKLFEKGEEFEMTVKRSDEVQKNIKEKYGIDEVMERLDGPDSDADNKSGYKIEEDGDK